MNREDSIGAMIRALRPEARAASSNAHAPYSQFYVGAALSTPDGRVFSACNVESASYGLTQCAERNALGSAVAAGVSPGVADVMVVYLPGASPLPPCGACRQVIAELMAPESVVISCCDSDDYEAWTIEELLPRPYLPR